MSNRRKVGQRNCSGGRHAGQEIDVGFAEVRFVIDENGLIADLCFDVPTELIPDLIEALEDLKVKAFSSWSESA